MCMKTNGTSLSTIASTTLHYSSHYHAVDDTPLGTQFVASPCTRLTFRVVRRGLRAPNRRPCGFDHTRNISLENPTWPATLGMARHHMLRNRIPTPFTSVFNNYRRALNWAGMLEQGGIQDIDIVVTTPRRAVRATLGRRINLQHT